MKLLIPLTLAALLAAGCGSSAPPAASPSEDPRRNADACRAFNDSLDLVREAMGPAGVPLGVETAVADETPKVEAAAQLAYDGTRLDMLRFAAALELWGAKQREVMQPGFTDGPAAGAVRNAARRVIADCKAAGVTVQPVG